MDGKIETERLRELLDELGVEYVTDDDPPLMETSWSGCTAFQLTPTAKLTMIVTPEMAIAATLGSDREKQLEELVREMWLTFYEVPFVCANPEALRDRAIALGVDMEVGR